MSISHIHTEADITEVSSIISLYSLVHTCNQLTESRIIIAHTDKAPAFFKQTVPHLLVFINNNPFQLSKTASNENEMKYIVHSPSNSGFLSYLSNTENTGYGRK